MNRLRATREASDGRAAPTHDVETELTRFAPDGLVVTARQPAAPPGRRTGRSSRTKRRNSCLQSAAAVAGRARARLYARRPAARRSPWPADMNDTGAIVASDVRPRRLTLLHDTVQRAGARVRRVVQVPARWSAAVRRAVRRSSSSTRPVPASARSGAIPTSAGGAARTICLPLARDQARICSMRAADGRPPGRTPRLRDLLERTGGERRRDCRVHRGAQRDFRFGDLGANASGRSLRHSSISTGSFGRRRPRMASRRSSPRS